MCGIVGIYNFNISERVSKNDLRAMADSISHRGPDEEGYIVNENIGFGFKRLAVIDLLSGQQPMTVNNAKVTIVFNGQIYNYVELRTELKKKGYNFNTESDTEVILNSYLEWGEECVLKFNGMWAFAILDNRNELKLFCSRDRMGIKPFYFYHTSDKFVFASEIKAFYKCNGIELKIDKDLLWDNLVFGPSSFGPTFYKNINELEPGCNILIYGSGKVSFQKYFCLEETFVNQKTSYDLEEIKESLKDAIKLRLRSDVPLASINSGGLDSSLISAIATRSINGLKTYSVAPSKCKDGKKLPGDESEYAEYLSMVIASDHSTIRYDSDLFFRYLEESIRVNDGELYHSNSIPIKLLFEKIKSDGMTVVLGGEGADEVFSGYYSNKLLNIVNILGNPLGKKILEYKFNQKIPIVNYFSDVRRSIPLLRSNYFEPQKANKLLGIAGYPSESRQKLFDIMKDLSPGNALSFYEQKTYLSGLLRRADRMAMAHGIELRVPYLDYRLVKLLNSVPHYLKVGISTTSEKKLLKLIASEFLPKRIINRPKYGFASPLVTYKDYLSKRLEFLNNNNLTLTEYWILNSIVDKDLLQKTIS